MPWPQRLLHIAAMIVGGIGAVSPCRARQPNGSATLVDLMPPGAEANTATCGRLAGTVVRPKDGVRHQALDDAWAAYDAVVAKAKSAISELIAKEVDAATAKGDLAAVFKWRSVDATFQTDGALLVEEASRAVACAALDQCLVAADELAGVYESLVKDLTRAQKIPEAEAVRQESLGVALAQRAAFPGGHPMLREKALRFDGKRSRIEVPHIPLDDFPNFTVEFWTKDWRGVVLRGGRNGDPENSFWLGSGDGRCTVVFESGKGKDNEWHVDVGKPALLSHVAWVFRGGESTVYFNGRQVDRRKIPGMGPFRRDRPLLLGAADDGRQKKAEGSGLLYALRISKVARYIKKFTPQRDWTVDEDTVLQLRAANATDGVLPDESRNKSDAVMDGVPVENVPAEIPASRR